MPCWRSSDCLEDKSAEVIVEFSNLDAAALSDEMRQALGAALASDLASACEVENASVVDLTGANATVSFGPGGRMSAWVRGVSGLTAHDLAARLYSASFQATLGNSTADVVGSAAGVLVASVSLEPKAFSPATTSTATTTTTATTTNDSAPMHADIPTQGHHDLRPLDPSSASALAAPMWWAVLAAALLSGGAR